MNRIEWGWEAARSGEGPAMYWYGWTATTLVAAAVADFLGHAASRKRRQEIPLDPGLAAPDPGDPLSGLGSQTVVVPPVGRT